MMKVSKFGRKIATQSGIGQLMDDLGLALAGSQDILMLGGGNPAHIPAVQNMNIIFGLDETTGLK